MEDRVASDSLLSPPLPPWTASALRLVLLLVVSVSAASAVRGSPAWIVAAVSAALVVAVGCAVVTRMTRLPVRAQVLALGVIGLAGAALSGLVPASAGFVLVYLAVIDLGRLLPSKRALTIGIVVLAAMCAAILGRGHVSLPGLLGVAAGAAFFLAIGVFTRSSRLAQEEARAAQARAEDLLEQLRASLDAQAQAAALAERARLAREIHDVLAHTLTGLVLALDTMELLGAQAEAEPDVITRMLEQVSRGQRIAREGLADTKRAIAALRGDDLPGPGLLDRLVQDTAQATGLRAELCVTGKPHAVSPEIGLTLYRTAQEALTNTARYAGPDARVRLSLSYDGDQVELAVDDVRADDAPPAPGPGLSSGGYGLTGMRERAELLGGSLSAGPTPRGFSLRLRLPCDTAMAPPSGVRS